jgi:hypothetical protein
MNAMLLRPLIYLCTLVWMVFLFTFHPPTVGAGDVYQEDTLGTVGNPLRQELDADPSLMESMDRFEDQVPSGQEKVIKVGVILLKEDNLYFSPVVQQSMAFEWWTLTGRASEIKAKLTPGVQTYCKLKGAREMTRRMHRKRESATMGFRDVYYTFNVDEIVWIKSIDQIMAIKLRIDKALEEADGFYGDNRCAEALAHYSEAKRLAQEFLPNAVSYAALEKASQCQSQVDTAQ